MNDYCTRDLAGLSFTRDGPDFLVPLPSGGAPVRVNARRPDIAQLVAGGVLVPKSVYQLATWPERKPGAFTAAQVYQLADLIGDALEGHDERNRRAGERAAPVLPETPDLIAQARAAVASARAVAARALGRTIEPAARAS
ncbi:hypothetical protein [Variovorax sp. Sphag1AA]|uniref:hypothetical protein n=1 Tax=Variovorax sp. Sphag1AA TaxID=2587027 RepID=UPI00160B4003|nr:hypothetical protein [Variovorax sp. Sphag1AA]MBB3180082.1 hypothetical protein [Variovorax sp. Sphag1AA]